ncbi:OmpA/MotB [Salmonella enterica subsp. enterica serovar Heidelberg str. 579083-10]|nr:OmpA/MotB [Salmonella enterica subsp. enterica serovar Heidelberg str. 579083-10]
MARVLDRWSAQASAHSPPPKKDRGKGALIGAAAGAALGGGVGYYMDVQEAKLRDKNAGHRR